MSEQPQSIKQSEDTSFYTVSGSGELYGLENQLVHVLAEANQTNQLFELVLITGGKVLTFHCIVMRRYLKPSLCWKGSWK